MESFKLKDIPKIETGFKVPENYFENFSSKGITHAQNKDFKIISIFKRHKKIVFAAASILVLALLLPFYNSYKLESNAIDTITLENYLTYELSLNPDDLVIELENEDINILKSTSEIENQTVEDLLISNAYFEHLLLDSK